MHSISLYFGKIFVSSSKEVCNLLKASFEDSDDANFFTIVSILHQSTFMRFSFLYIIDI